LSKYWKYWLEVLVNSQPPADFSPSISFQVREILYENELAKRLGK
jgi:hypothetical protein